MSQVLDSIKQAMSDNIDKIIANDPEHKAMPEGGKQFYKNTVTAGLKMMFDPNTHANMELMKNPASRQQPVETIASGIAGLVWLMFQQSKKTMPIPIMIMAGSTLAAEAMDFAERGLGIKFNNDMIAKTTQLTAEHLFTKLGISQQQLRDAVENGREEIQNHLRQTNNS